MTAIRKTGTILQDHPAFEIRAAAPERHSGLKADLPIFRAGDLVGLPFETARYGTMYHWFTFGSAASYALAYAECPIRAHQDAQAKGHKTHWLNASPTTITAEARAKETRVAVEWGDKVIFEGRIFEIVREANQNAGLREVPLQEQAQTEFPRIKIRHWCHMEGLDSDCSQEVQNPYNPASEDGQHWQRGRNEAIAARKGGAA